MSAASLIGFGAVFVAVAWAGALVARVALAAVAPHLIGRPETRRHVHAVALIAPPLLAAAVTLALLGHSLVVGGPGDHCAGHPHHLHLCLAHGAAWGEVPLAWVALLGFGALAVVRAVGLARRVHASARAVAVLRAAAVYQGEVGVVPSARWFGFVGGLGDRRVLVSSAAWDALDPDQRAALIAHETAHAERGDGRTRLALELAALLAPPRLAAPLLAGWQQAAEEACDRRAAEVVGDPTVVASALLAFARAEPAPAFASAIHGGALARRVEALLAEPVAERAALLRIVAGCILFASIAAVAWRVDPLHHALETLLGVL